MKKLLSIAAISVAMTALTCSGAIKHVMGVSKHHTFSDTTIYGATPEVRLARYIKELKDFDVNITVPDNYHSADIKAGTNMMNYIRTAQYKEKPIADMIMVAIESDSNDAVFCFPNIFYGDSAYVTRSANSIGTEIRQWLNIDPDNAFANKDLDVSQFVEVITKDDMSEYADADTVMVYGIELKKKVLDKYKFLIGVYLRKKCYPALPLKIVLTEKSYADRDKYIRLLLDNISYGDNPAEYLIRSEELTGKLGWKDWYQ